MKYTTKTIYIAEDGREFYVEQFVKEYCNEHILVDGDTLNIKDIVEFEDKLDANGIGWFFKSYDSMCNSNSMGCMYPLNIMSHIIEKRGMKRPEENQQ